jgi:hypothetical protein
MQLNDGASQENEMGFLDVLEKYAERAGTQAGNADPHADFDEVATNVPPESLGQGVAQAFRSDQTPDLSSMISQSFGAASPDQRAGLLSHLAQSIGPALLGGLGGGLLSRLTGGGASADVSPAAAAGVSPEQAGTLAQEASARDPSVIDRLGGFYAQHPELVKTLGGLAMGVAMSHIASQRR